MPEILPVLTQTDRSDIEIATGKAIAIHAMFLMCDTGDSLFVTFLRLTMAALSRFCFH